MATYTINIDEKDIAGQHFLAYIKTLPFISLTEKKKEKMNDLDEALEDIRMGRLSKPMNMEEFKAYTQKIWDEA